MNKEKQVNNAFTTLKILWLDLSWISYKKVQPPNSYSINGLAFMVGLFDFFLIEIIYEKIKINKHVT